MGSREYMYSVAAGPTPQRVQAAVDAFDDPADAWAWALSSSTVSGFPTLLVFEGPGAAAFARRAVPHLRSTFGVEVLDEHELAMRYDARYRAGVLARAHGRAG